MRPIRILTCLALAAFAAACGEKAEAPQTPPPALPTGRLQELASGVTETRFLGLDDLRKGDGVVQATVLIVGATATSANGKYAFVAKREMIDCGANRTVDEVVSVFDEAGRQVGTEAINTGRMGRAMESSETEGQAACGQAPKRGATVTGWKAAQRAVQAPPADLEKTARADDYDAQAWLCAAAVRGRANWTALPACERALKMRPDDLALRMDHGYRSLVANKISAAEADFSKIIAAEPDSAPALFGRSLALMLSGKKAAGQPDHDKAMQIDPKVNTWVQATYKVYITDPYK